MANNLIEHIFNVHDDCNKDWCYAKRALEENLTYIPSEDHNFYCKHRDKNLYDQLVSIIAKINTLEIMVKSLHDANSQINEEFNQSFTRYAPKNKHLSSSECLQIRLYVAVGVHNYGFAKFWKSVCSYLKINDKMLWKYFDEEQARIDKRRKKTKDNTNKTFQKVQKWSERKRRVV